MGHCWELAGKLIAKRKAALHILEELTGKARQRKLLGYDSHQLSPLCVEQDGVATLEK